MIGPSATSLGSSGKCQVQACGKVECQVINSEISASPTVSCIHLTPEQRVIYG